jgi:hypothetical protein
MNFNRLTIVVDDGTVFLDQQNYIDLDLSSCGIPENVHALQWMNGRGWIEFLGASPNEYIEVLPTWATNCVTVWETKYSKEQLKVQRAFEANMEQFN